MRSTPRITFIALHFAEYSYRLCIELAKRAEVHLVIDGVKLEKEMPGGLDALASRGCVISQYRRTSPRFKVSSATRAIQDVWRFSPDLCIAHEYSLPLPTLITVSARLRAPLQLIVHDPKPHMGNDAVDAGKTAHLRDFTRRIASRLLVHGEYCAAQLRQQLHGDRRISPMPHGPLGIPAEAQVRRPIPGRVLFFGRLERYKGLDTLFKAADLLATQVSGFELEILGDGSEAGCVSELAATRPHVTFNRGYAPADDVIRAMQEACVIALPYDEASQSGVLAMAFGNSRPVVCTAVGSMPEVVTPDRGLVVPPQAPSALAHALRDLLTKPDLWHRLSLGASAAASGELSWSHAASTILREKQLLP